VKRTRQLSQSPAAVQDHLDNVLCCVVGFMQIFEDLCIMYLSSFSARRT